MDLITLVYGIEYDNNLILNFYKQENFLDVSFNNEEFRDAAMANKSAENYSKILKQILDSFKKRIVTTRNNLTFLTELGFKVLC